MIDYAVLCNAIADWRAGHTPAPAQYAAETTYESAEELEEYVEEEAEEAEEADAEVTEAPQQEEHTVIYNLPLIPMDEDEDEDAEV